MHSMRAAVLLVVIPAHLNHHGASSGRVIYIFTGGKDGEEGGDSNMRGYSKLREVITVAACYTLSSDGIIASEYIRRYVINIGANLFVNAPSQGQADKSANLHDLFPGIITPLFSPSSTTR